MSEPQVISALQAQAEHERFAAASYLALSLWFESEDYSGFAGFFKKQWAEENEHTEKLHQYLLDVGVKPELGAMEAPVTDFENVFVAVKHAQALEIENSKGIHGCHELAAGAKDYPAQVMLQWFISEQVEEEAWASKMVTLVERAGCAGAMYSLDRHIMKEFSG